MSVPLSDTRLTEIRDCWQAATGGRWLVDRHGAFGETTVIADQGEHAATIGSMDFGDSDQADADRTFVMYAHRDVGVLLAEVERLRAQRAAVVELHDWDELVFGGFYCMHCSPEGSLGEPISWPCPTLRAVGMTDEEALAIITAHRAAIAATTAKES